VARRAPGVEAALEPWYRVMEGALRPPFRLWFNWRFEGLEEVPATGPLIVAGNHLSYLDPFAHAYFVVEAGRRPRFLAKRELFDNRLLGVVLRGANQIPVDRVRGGREPLEAAARALAEGEVVVIYPEGTSATSDPAFLPGRGKTGAVRLSLRTGVPILPVATWGGQYVWRRSGRQRLTFGRPIWLRAGERFDPTDLAGAGGEPDVRGATDELMRRLTDLARGLADGYPARWRGR
jgi:1-acyl-sn-glycerol-3-phosphate acyltransferase